MSRRILVGQLEKARSLFCGVGTRQTKLSLNRHAKNCPRARAFRLALEIEDCSTQAKKYFGEWKDKKYAEKHQLILDLIRVFEAENWIYGIHAVGGFPPHIVYFELPDCEQISFHTTFINPEEIPVYAGEWDGRRNSTLSKLEAAIANYFDEKRILFK